jgi:N-acetylneuraminic acid mutarotase
VLNGQIYVLGGIDNANNILDSMEIYDPVADEWTFGPNMPDAGTGEAHVIGNKIYTQARLAVNSVHIFDPNTDQWSTVIVNDSGGQFGSSDTYADAFWGDLVVGVEGASVLDANMLVHAYQPSENQWLSGTPLQVRELLRPSVTVVGDTMYVIGGFGGATSCSFSSCDRGALDWVLKYDLPTDVWDPNSAADMDTERDHLETVNFNGNIIALGGNPVGCSSSSCSIGSPMRSAESYNPGTNTWTDISSMLTPRKDFTAVVLGGDLYVVGGDDGSEEIAIVERYRP